MRQHLNVMLSTVFTLFCMVVNAQQVIQLAPKEMHKKAAKDKAIYLDVRTPQEWNKGHIAKAMHIDIFSDDFEAQLKKLDKNKTYFVYCAVGGRSSEATTLMAKLGFKHIYNMQGGFKAWEREGLPSVK